MGDTWMESVGIVPTADQRPCPAYVVLGVSQTRRRCTDAHPDDIGKLRNGQAREIWAWFDRLLIKDYGTRTMFADCGIAKLQQALPAGPVR